MSNIRTYNITQMRIRILSFLILLVLAGCNDSPETNACTEIGTNIPWLNNLKNSIKNCTCQTSVVRGTYNNQTVFYITITDPACNFAGTPTLYTCEGEKVKDFTISLIDQQDMIDNLQINEILYTCKH